jgi:hypothetical protein
LKKSATIAHRTLSPTALLTHLKNFACQTT